MIIFVSHRLQIDTDLSVQRLYKKNIVATFVICNFAPHNIVLMFFLFIAQLYFQEAEHALRHCLQ